MLLQTPIPIITRPASKTQSVVTGSVKDGRARIAKTPASVIPLGIPGTLMDGTDAETLAEVDDSCH